MIGNRKLANWCIGGTGPWLSFGLIFWIFPIFSVAKLPGLFDLNHDLNNSKKKIIDLRFLLFFNR